MTVGDQIQDASSKCAPETPVNCTQVNAGQAVLILEAMKMRNVLYSAAKGVVKELCVPVGESVDDGATLVVFE